MSDGLQAPKPFSSEELEHALEFHAKLLTLAPKGDFVPGAPKPSMTTHGSRLGRALYWIQPAMATSKVETKVISYCLCLEALFSTDVNLISQRVSERVARLIGTTGAERRQVFDDVGDFYNLRSRVVHGTQLNVNKVLQMRRLAVVIDGYLRRALVRLLNVAAMCSLFSDPADKEDQKLKAFFFNQKFPHAAQ